MPCMQHVSCPQSHIRSCAVPLECVQALQVFRHWCQHVLLKRRFWIRRHYTLAVTWIKSHLPQLPWAQKSSWAGQGIMDRAMGPC